MKSWVRESFTFATPRERNGPDRRARSLKIPVSFEVSRGVVRSRGIPPPLSGDFLARGGGRGCGRRRPPLFGGGAGTHPQTDPVGRLPRLHLVVGGGGGALRRCPPPA